MEKSRNVGTVDAYIRITVGLAALTWVGARNGGSWRWPVTLLGAMKVAEGITRYCPLLEAAGMSTLESVARQNGQAPADEHQAKGELPNPFTTDT